MLNEKFKTNWLNLKRTSIIHYLGEMDKRAKIIG